MDRRTFITGAAGAAALAAGRGTAAQKRLKVLIPAMSPEQIADLKATAPNVELIVCKNTDEALAQVADADGVYGLITPEIIRAGKKLKWVQTGSAGVENYVTIPELVNSDIVLTNMQKMFGPQISDHAMGFLLSFTRSLPYFLQLQAREEWGRPPQAPLPVMDELQDKTMQIIGLGGIGSNIARRAHGFGMHVLATDPKVAAKPDYVDELHLPDAFHRLLPRADVLVSAVPLTPQTRGMVGEREFGMMKKGVIFINMSRGKVVNTDALVQALESKKLAAAGLDVTDPEPLPKGHPLWKQNVVITPHCSNQSPAGRERIYRMFRENLRRFGSQESLLNIVDKKAGY
ncbi:MAG TPA: D-2-hydroxyacid dehydrogenase [Armatimonadota bacterium]|nr:D-2-hydroxyacid dehydrogenase [Armatimonadota bacterium]